MNKLTMLKIFCISFLGIFLVDCGGEKNTLDKQMELLCKQDGGSKVYEKIVLPENMFDELGYPFPGWRDRLNSDARLSKDYQYVREEKILKQGEPFSGAGEGRLRKVKIQIVRKADSKILGEFVGYFRAGGDGFFWFGHPSSNSCPANGEPIEKLVFVKQ